MSSAKVRRIQTMPFLQLTFDCARFEPEAFESACFAAGALSVTLTDAADTPILEPQLGTTPLWPDVKAAILFAADADRTQIIDTLTQELDAQLPEHRFEEIADRVWERECLADLQALKFGKRLWICPQGHEVSTPGAVVVKLDPGLAFGTGTHPTTAMCLQWLDGAKLTNKKVLDYGCGSGVLGIAALKLGARHAVGVDHDPQALLATRDNAERNGVERDIETLAPGAALDPADILLANILALPLIELAEHFQRYVRLGGHIVLSGILAQQADAVAAAYQPWFELDEPIQQDDWICLHGIRR